MIDFDDYKMLSDYGTDHVFMSECKIFLVLKIKKKNLLKRMMINGQMRLK